MNRMVLMYLKLDLERKSSVYPYVIFCIVHQTKSRQTIKKNQKLHNLQHQQAMKQSQSSYKQSIVSKASKQAPPPNLAPSCQPSHYTLHKCGGEIRATFILYR